MSNLIQFSLDWWATELYFSINTITSTVFFFASIHLIWESFKFWIKGIVLWEVREYLRMRPNRWATDPQLIQFVELKLLLWVFRNVMNGLVLLLFSINSNSRTTTIHSHILPIGCWRCDVRWLCTDTWPRFLQWNEAAIRQHIQTMCMYYICCIYYMHFDHMYSKSDVVYYFFFCLSPNHKLSSRVLWLNIVKQLLLIFFFCIVYIGMREGVETCSEWILSVIGLL